MKRFYQKRRVDLDRVVTLGKDEYGFPEYLVLESAKQLYIKILKGEEISDISLIHRIIADAKTLKRNEKDIGLESLYELTKVVESIANEVGERVRDVNDSVGKVKGYVDTRLTENDDYIVERMNNMDEWTLRVVREMKSTRASVNTVRDSFDSVNKELERIRHTVSRQSNEIRKLNEKKTFWQRVKDYLNENKTHQINGIRLRS